MKDWRDHSGSASESESARPSLREPGKGPSVGAVQRKAAAASEPAVGGVGAAKDEEPILIAHDTAPVQKKSDPIQKKDEHRGRIQVQGGGLELSDPWAQDSPRTKADGLAGLAKLKGMLGKKELKIRAQAFERAEKFINNTVHTTPPNLKRTFQNDEVMKDNGDERVDIEISAGKAFV